MKRLLASRYSRQPNSFAEPPAAERIDPISIGKTSWVIGRRNRVTDCNILDDGFVASGAQNGFEMTVTIRNERPEDIAAIDSVNHKAFGQPQESQLVHALRKNGGVLLSLVAALNHRVVGHILYTPVSVGRNGQKMIGSGLGPMAVLPEYQRQGIGSQLVATGNERLRQSGYPFIVVLGHAEYYPRFGFKPASEYFIRSEWEVPDNAFMILVLDQLKMAGISGVARYRQGFSNVV